MKPLRPENPDQSELFRSRLDSQIKMNHEMGRLSVLIDWTVFDDRFGELDYAEVRCSGKPTGPMVGLLYLKHLYNLSDGQLVIGWLENPYWQYFCGESYFQTDWPIDPIIGHLKTDGWLGRNHLKGTGGDSMNVLLSYAGHDPRLHLKRLRDSYARIFCRSVVRWVFCRKPVPSRANYGFGALNAA